MDDDFGGGNVLPQKTRFLTVFSRVFLRKSFCQIVPDWIDIIHPTREVSCCQAVVPIFTSLTQDIREMRKKGLLACLLHCLVLSCVTVRVRLGFMTGLGLGPETGFFQDLCDGKR